MITDDMFAILIIISYEMDLCSSTRELTMMLNNT